MKKITLFVVLLSAGTLFAQHNQYAQKNPRHAQMMMSMHKPMMDQAHVTGVHPDISFLENMIPHHKGAIDSSKMVLKLSKNAEIKNLAKKIIAAQEKEIANFQKMIAKFKTEAKSLKGLNVKKYDADARANMSTMMKHMSAVEPSEDIDRDFLLGMTAHHTGAVAASKQILQYTKNEDIKKIANTIISDQEAEIKEFQKILSK